VCIRVETVTLVLLRSCNTSGITGKLCYRFSITCERFGTLVKILQDSCYIIHHRLKQIKMILMEIIGFQHKTEIF